MKLKRLFTRPLITSSLIHNSLIVLLFCWAGSNALAVTDTQQQSEISSAQIESKIKEIEATQDIDDALKKQLIELYRKALSLLESTRHYEYNSQLYTQAIEVNPQKTKQLRAKLENTKKTEPSAKSMGVSEKLPLADLEQHLASEKAALTAVSSKYDELEKKLDNVTERPKAARQRLAEANRQQKQIANEPQSASPVESPLLIKAQQLLLTVRQNAVRQEIQMLNQELLSQDPRLEYLQVESDLTERQLTNAQVRVKWLQTLVNSRRIDEANQAQVEAAEAEKEASNKPSLIRNLAKQNADLGQQLATLAGEIEKLGKQKEAIENKAKQIENDFESTQHKLQVAGLSEALGISLADQRLQLQELRQLKKRARQRDDLIAEIGLRQLQHSEQLNELDDLDRALQNEMEGVDVQHLSDEAIDRIHDEARTLLKDRRELLAKATDIDSTYLRALGDLDFSEQRLLDVAQEYKHFLDEHLLWIPSDRHFTIRSILKLPAGILWLTAPSNWEEVGQVLLDEAVKTPLAPLATVLLVAALLRFRPQIKQLIDNTAIQVGRPTVDRFSYTFHALWATLLLALPLPLLIVVAAWLLMTSASTGFPQLVGQGLGITAPMLFNLFAFRALCKVGGVAEVHFGWSKAVLKILRVQVDRLTVISLPAAFIAIVAGNEQEQHFRDSLGIMSYVVVMLALTYFVRQVLSPKRGILHATLMEQPQGWPARLQMLWYPLVVIFPLALATLASLGYFYTAGVLTYKMVDTIWLILGIVTVKMLVLRWLMLTRRKLALQVAREKRAAARAALEAANTEEETGMVAIEKEALDLATIDVQTRKLLNVGAILAAAVGTWLIWSEVLPALGILDQISLWQTTLSIDGEVKVMPITLADLGLAVVIGILTTVAAKNLPGVLELAFLQLSGLDAGSRYAVKMLTQYLIVAIGFILVFQTVGFSWSQIQWLVAALGVGLGFGLQEIFGNFISGLIILFERPIRVGDIVTVGDTTGMVTRIRIRATTITNWDRQELLVPNKEFITNRLLNWTLTDQSNRIVVNVGLAYGSDVKLALALLAQIAAENEHILDDPQPLITFEGFGDNSLALVLRAYLSTLEYRLATISALHQTIHEKFNDAGLVIAFPQRDVHLETSRPLDIRLLRQASDFNVGNRPVDEAGAT